jgi:phage terminase large subunit GpA-like protein
VIPDFISESLTILKPPEKLTVSEWSAKKRILDSKTSAIPGIWRNEQTPYLVKIMDAFNDPEVEEIIFVKSTQVGGTETLNNMIGYVIEQDPSSTLVVYPTLELAEFTSDNRIKPMVKLCPSLDNKFDDDSKRLELQFDGMYLVLSGANSASSLASRPIRFLFLDEVDKYPANAGKEADPISLARERTKTFVNNKKIFQTSTPTLKTGPIWQEWLGADTQYKYFVSCPHCGHQDIFSFKNLKFDSKATPEKAKESAFYFCTECGSLITDNEKLKMIETGEWKNVNGGKSKRRIAFWINAFYSPWVKFGDFAYEFVNCKKYPLKLMNFINSWLAEPWEDVETSNSSEMLLKKQNKYDKGVVPKDTVLITAGADIQRKSIYYTIRAWQSDMTNHNIEHGQVFSFRELEIAMNRTFYNENGEGHIVNLCCIDSGDQTDDVYDFCYINYDWSVPVKGSSQKMNSKFKISTIDKQNSQANGMKLVLIDTDFYKDMISTRIRKQEGGFFVYDGCDMDYADQVTSEQKVTEKTKAGKTIQTWKPKKTNVDNHYFDCEVYAYCAADICGIRDVLLDEYQEQQEPVQNIQTVENEWLKKSNRSGSWLQR